MAVVKLHKKVKSDNYGIVNIMYFGNGKKKQKSLNFKMGVDDFNTNFIKSLNQFTPSSNYNYKIINQLINDNIDLDVFTVLPISEVTTTSTLLNYFDNKIELLTNQNTISNYRTVRKHLESYLTTLSKDDIELQHIDLSFLISFKNHIISTRKCEGTTTLRYLTIIITVLTTANDDGLIKLNLHNLKKKLSINKIRYVKPLLSISDIKKMIACDSVYKHYKFVNIALLQLFGNGMRQSDVFLLRYSNFEQNYIEYNSQKTNKLLQIPYSTEVVDILFKIFNLELPNYKLVPKISNFQDRQKHQLKQVVLNDHILSKDNNDLLFGDLFKDDILCDYDTRQDMNEKQFRSMNYLTKKYNANLKAVKTDLELEITNITSHTFRHSYTNLMLDSGLGVYDISNSLGHSNIAITQSYIKSSFPIKRNIDNANRISNLIKRNKT